MGSAILLFSRSCYKPLSKHQSWSPLLLEQVLLVYYQHLQTSPFSVQLLRTQLPHECLAVELGFNRSLEVYCHHHSSYLYSSEQYSVHLLRISSSSVRHFPELSWIFVIKPASLKLDPSTADILSYCNFCSDKLQSPCTGYLSSPFLLSSGPSEPLLLAFLYFFRSFFFILPLL